MGAPVFLTDPDRIADDVIVLDGREGHHASVVRRIRAGERVDLTDGAGGVARCVVEESSKSGLVCRVESRYAEAAPSPRLVVVQALPKAERGQLAVELLTEIGADVIVPWAAARCVAQWRGERAARSLDKWRTTAREAAKQARRPWLPEVRPLASTADVEAILATAAVGVVLHESASEPLAKVAVPQSGELAVVVGPEGGLTDDEVNRFARVGAVPVHLGSPVLRTSTAGVAAASALLSRTRRWS